MLEDLQIFATVVEQASLNRASRILNLSQPGLSRKIKSLEDRLNVRLFERRGKRLELTPVGQISYDYAIEIRNLLQRFQGDLAKYKNAGKSSVTIGASLTTLQSTLPDLIMLFTGQDPQMDIQAVTGKTHEIVSLVKERKVDIGLIASRIEDRSLVCVPLFDDHLCLVLPKRHPLADATGLEISDLMGLPMILFSKGTWYRILMDELFQRYAVIPKINMEIDSFEAIIRLVSTCHVATLLPKSYLRDNLVRDNDLVVRSVAELLRTKRTTSLVFVDWPLVNATTRRVIQQAAEYFSDGSMIRTEI